MSFKVTYGQLRNDLFIQGVAKIVGFTEYNDYQLTYNVSKIDKKLAAEDKIMRAALEKMTKEYVETDEKGNFIWAEGRYGQMKPKSDEHHERYTAELEKFEQVEVTIECHQIPLQILCERVKLSAQELAACDSLADTSAAHAPKKSPVRVVPPAKGKVRR